jgi:uncharacterized protein (DUF433 family)
MRSSVGCWGEVGTQVKAAVADRCAHCHTIDVKRKEKPSRDRFTNATCHQARGPPLHQDARGVIRVGETRVTLESVIRLFDQGATAEEIALRFDTLNLHDIYATLGYYLGHRQQVQTYLLRQRQTSLAARRAAESRSPTAQIRERLHRQRTHGDAPPAA